MRSGYTTLVDETSVARTRSFLHCQNILWMPDGTLAPRSASNLKKLRAYAKRMFKHDYHDKRTKAYRFMRLHDSEFGREE